MSNPEHSSSASFNGHFKNGVVVPDAQVALPEGQAVRVEPLPRRKQDLTAKGGDDRVRHLQSLFSQWTEEDGKLSDEEADRLHKALEQNRGLDFRARTVD
jgi:hypothetical protein